MNKYITNKIEPLAEKAGITLKDAQNMVLYEHNLKLYKKSELVSLDLNLDSKSLELVNKLAKMLKVSTHAVIGIAILNHIDEKNKKK